MTLAMRIGQASVAFTAVTRLPMVAGWDRMLPAWFSRLHPVYKTPVNSIAVVGAASFGIASLSLIGVGQAEAFQLVFNASGIFYALTYVVMFAIPLFGLRGVTPRAAAVAAAGVVVRPADDGALHRALRVPDHPGRERVHVRAQDHADDRGNELCRDRHSVLGAPAVRPRDGSVVDHPFVIVRTPLGRCERGLPSADWHDTEYYSRSPERNPAGPDQGVRRAARGGAWRHAHTMCRVTLRSKLDPSFRYNDFGFRLARSC